MAETNIVTWSGRGGLSFYVKATEIRGFKDLSIDASVTTEDAEKNGEKYVKRKQIGSYSISMTAVLSAALGVDVKAVALQMTEAARNGDTGYFYIGAAKLFPSSFMATSAKISNIEVTASGAWKYCEVNFTLKQASKYGGAVSTSKSSSKKKSSSSRSGSSRSSSKSKSWKKVEYTHTVKTSLQVTNTAKTTSKSTLPIRRSYTANAGKLRAATK